MKLKFLARLTVFDWKSEEFLFQDQSLRELSDLHVSFVFLELSSAY